jgi:hypothetical protein
MPFKKLWSTIANKLSDLETQVESVRLVLFGTSTDEAVLVLPLNLSISGPEAFGNRSGLGDVKTMVQDILKTEISCILSDPRLIGVFLPDAHASQMVVLSIGSNLRRLGLLILGVDGSPGENDLKVWQQEAQWIG